MWKHVSAKIEIQKFCSTLHANTFHISFSKPALALLSVSYFGKHAKKGRNEDHLKNKNDSKYEFNLRIQDKPKNKDDFLIEKQ